MAISFCDLSIAPGFCKLGQVDTSCLSNLSPRLKKYNGVQWKRPSQHCKRNFCISAQYKDRKSGGGVDFVAGFMLGGVVIGTLGYLLAPQIKTFFGEKQKDFYNMRINIDDDEGIEKTRRNLNEKIAKLNDAIDNVAAQLKAENGTAFSDDDVVKLESAAQ